MVFEEAMKACMCISCLFSSFKSLPLTWLGQKSWLCSYGGQYNSNIHGSFCLTAYGKSFVGPPLSPEAIKSSKSALLLGIVNEGVFLCCFKEPDLPEIINLFGPCLMLMSYSAGTITRTLLQREPVNIGIRCIPPNAVLFCWYIDAWVLT